VAAPTPSPNGVSTAPPSVSARLRAERPAVGNVARADADRISVAGLRRELGRARRNLPVRQGEGAGLDRRLGSGKTTLLRSLNRLTEVTAGGGAGGSVTLDGEESTRWRSTRCAGACRWSSQAAKPFPMSIFDNVAYRIGRAESPVGAGAAQPELEQRCEGRALVRGGLYDEVAGDLERSALKLSGGQQAAAVHRARARRPPEVCCSTSPARRSTRSPRNDRGADLGLRETVAIVDRHDNLQQAFRVATTSRLSPGSSSSTGPGEQVFDRPAQAPPASYIGGAFG